MRTLAALLGAFMTTTLWAQQLSPGEAARGAAIFSGKGNCQSCHRVRDTGSRLGPDLTDIGAVRSAEHLQTSLLDPDAEILPENRFYRVVTREGTAITGRLLNLDTFQVLMMDPKEQLRSFARSELREDGFIKGSPMPSYRETLSPQDLADIVVYLATLKGVVPE
jgi:putative heme-binding domain-containing protein